LSLVGGVPSSASVNFDTYRNCAYFADNPGESGLADGSVVVADVSDPHHPVITDHLTARAFANPGESLRVYARRGLLVGDHYDTLQLNPNQVNYIHDLAVSWGYAQILDVSNPAKPFQVSRIQTGVDNPANCAKEAADREPQKSGLSKGDPFWAAIGTLLLYDFHQCSADRLHDPTIVACANFGSGLRVFDIRDPRHPRELAYYNTGTLSRTDLRRRTAGHPPRSWRDLVGHCLRWSARRQICSGYLALPWRPSVCRPNRLLRAPVQSARPTLRSAHRQHPPPR
jgi:hypothetical protein